MKRSAEVLAAVILITIGIAVGIRHVPLSVVEGYEVEGAFPETPSIARILGKTVGENRFRLSLGKLEKEIEALPYVIDAELKAEGGILKLDTVPAEGIMMIGAGRALFTDGKMLQRLPDGDAEALRNTYFPLSVERGRAAYAEEFGLSPEFQRVTALMLELSGGLCYNNELMSRGSYTASDGPGFGTLVLESDTLGADIIIREDLSGESLSSLLGIILERGPSEGFRHQTYEIKDNTLKMRKEG